MKKLAFTGGSLTAGDGWDKSNPDDTACMWVNLVHQNIPKFQDLELINAGRSGYSNAEIFKETIKVIAENSDLKYIICSWVGLLRYNFSVGFELYDTEHHVNNVHEIAYDTNLNTGKVEKAYIENIKNRFLALHHYQFEICKLIEFVNIINQLCKHTGITVYHINDSCPWDENHFVRLTGDSIRPEDYTDFIKKDILNIENRDDSEIHALYKKMHDQYEYYGGIQAHTWINLDRSFEKDRIDFNHDNRHAGKRSNQLHYQTVKNFFNK